MYNSGDSSVVASDGSDMSSTSGVSHFSNDSSRSVEHSAISLDNAGVMGEAMSLHHREQFMDHSMGMSGSVSNYRVELIYESVMGNNGVHLGVPHRHMTF